MTIKTILLTRILRPFAMFAATCLCATSMAAPFAYVPNEKSGTISVIDTESDSVVAEIKAGDKPRGMAASKDGKTLYVSDQPNNVLVKVDLDQRIASGTVELGESPEGVSISPNGKWVAAASEISNSVNLLIPQLVVKNLQ